MADGAMVDVDDTALRAAMAALPDVMAKLGKEACHLSADHMRDEMRSRIARATGKTADHIEVTEVDDGYVVHTSDVDPETGDYFKELHVGLWLEKGTRAGTRKNRATTPAQPWFFVSAALELPLHVARVAEAVQEATAEQGLGA